MWIDYFKRFMSNNENIKEDWYGRWWGILTNESSSVKNSTNPRRNQTHQNFNQNDNFITKQLKAIHAKSKEVDFTREREREKEKAREIEREKSKLKSRPITTETSANSDHTSPDMNPNEKDTIMRDYDVEFYMKRGLSQNEAIQYIFNKLMVKQLWSKICKNH